MIDKIFSISIEIKKILFYKKKIYFKNPISLKNKKYSSKEIIIIFINTNLKRFQLEVAPLPNYQENQLEKYFFYLRKWKREIEKKKILINKKNFFSIAKKWTKNIPFDCLQWSISSLLLSIYYFKFYRCSFPIENNFLLLDLENLPKYPIEPSTYKIKIGRKNIKKEIFQLKKIISKLKKNQKIRLDGNQLWSEKDLFYFLKEMKEKLHFFEYIEEPIQKSNLLNSYQNQINFAIDETLLSTEFRNFKKTIKENFSAIVLKPSFIGCLSKIYEIINWAKKNKIKVTISSVFETKIGHQMIFKLIYFSNLEKNIHGADTYRFLRT